MGSLFKIRNARDLAIHRIAKKYGDICSLRLGGVPTVIISHPDLLTEAFEKPELSDRWGTEIMNILTHHGKDLAFSPYGEHWKKLQRFANRDLLSMRNLQRIREQHIEDVVSKLVEEVAETSDSGEMVRPLEMLNRNTAVIMFRSIFGRNENETAEFEKNRDELFKAILSGVRNASATNWADYIRLLKIIPNAKTSEAKRQSPFLDGILESLIDTARDRPELDLANPTCLVEVMLAKEKEGELTAETILLLIADLFHGGVITSANTVSWLLFVLANRPAIQSKIHEEIDRVIGFGNEPAIEDRERLPYLNAVIMESMRHRTVGAFNLPHKAAKPCDVGGYHIPQGALVLGNLYSIHHDPRFWDSPDKFAPDRFMPMEDGTPSPAMTSNNFFPFGVGLRRCPGRRFGELLVWMHAARFLQRFKFKLAGPETNMLPEDDVFGLGTTLKPFSIQVTERTTANSTSPI